VGGVTICWVIDGHAWAQELPLRNNTLVCMTCSARTPMRAKWCGDSCAKRFADQRGLVYAGYEKEHGTNAPH
jgi:ribosomal protein L40E